MPIFWSIVTVLGSGAVLYGFIKVLMHFTPVSMDFDFHAEDCWYCVDENGKPQGWLELFNDVEYQGKIGYWPATRINGNVIPCPVCGGNRVVTESDHYVREQ
jgi:hypothetical protein